MSIFTGHELEFLASLNKSWWRLYWKELSRLRRIESKSRTAGIPGGLPEFSGSSEDLVGSVQRRQGATGVGAGHVLQRRVELIARNG